MIQLANRRVFVAIDNMQIVGWIHALVVYRIASKFVVENGGLVVDVDCFKQSIGKRLIKKWYRNISKKLALYLRNNTKCLDVHQFCARLCFIMPEEQKVFEIQLLQKEKAVK